MTLRIPAAAALSLLAAAATSASPARGYELSWHRAAADDPGVVAVRAGDALQVRRVWFGDVESDAVAPWAPSVPGVSVAVPAGRAGRQVQVRAEFEDGSVRRLGAFRYEDPARGRRERWIGSGRGCPSGSVGTFSGARNLGRGRFRYTYRIENGTPGPVRVDWPALQFLGFAAAFAVTVPAGEIYTITRVAGGPPVEVQGTATSDSMPGCEPDEAGTSWSGPAFFPASDLPTVPPVADLAATVDAEGVATVTWTHPGGAEPPDRFLVTRQTVQVDYDECAGPRRLCGHPTPVLPYSQTDATADGAARSFRSSLLLYGVSTISVRAQRQGVASAPQIVSAIVR